MNTKWDSLQSIKWQKVCTIDEVDWSSSKVNSLNLHLFNVITIRTSLSIVIEIESTFKIWIGINSELFPTTSR